MFELSKKKANALINQYFLCGEFDMHDGKHLTNGWGSALS
jgi:hypothetical protein